MVDVLIGSTPFALIHSVGGVGAVVGTALVTLFHSSILNLAKMFLDPLNNDKYSVGVRTSRCASAHTARAHASPCRTRSSRIAPSRRFHPHRTPASTPASPTPGPRGHQRPYPAARDQQRLRPLVALGRMGAK